MAKPVYSIRRGVIQLAAWETSGPEGQKGYSFKLNRRYKDKRTGEWTDSPFFFDSDLPVAAALLQKAFADLCVTSGSGEGSSSGAPREARQEADSPRYVTRGADGRTKIVDESGEEVPF